MTVRRLLLAVRLASMLVAGMSLVAIGVSKHADSVREDKWDCYITALIGQYRVSTQEDNHVTQRIARACGMTDPTPGVHMVPLDG